MATQVILSTIETPKHNSDVHYMSIKMSEINWFDIFSGQQQAKH